MAKSTAHKALASCKAKLTAALAEVRFLTEVNDVQGGRLRYWQNRSSSLSSKVLSLQEQLLKFTSGTPADVVQLQKNIAEVEARLTGSDERLRVVLTQAAGAAYELKAANEQVVNLQNRNERLRSDFESYKNAAWIYGTIAVVAAYGLGTAIQHFFPLPFGIN